MVDSRARGFTLIELLIVIAIIGILAAVLLPNLLNARNAAQIRQLQVHSRNMQIVAVAWLASDATRSAADAVDTWSPCLTAITADGYSSAAAPAPATSCTLAEAATSVDATVVGTVGGTTYTYVNGEAGP